MITARAIVDFQTEMRYEQHNNMAVYETKGMIMSTDQIVIESNITIWRCKKRGA